MSEALVSIILDVFVLLTLVIFILLGRAKGFLSALIELVGQILAVVVGGYIGSAVANFIYKSYLQEKITNTIMESVTNSTEIKSVVEGIEAAITKLPWFISGTLQNNIGTMFGDLQNNISGTGSSLVGAILDSSVKPIIIGLLTMLVFTIVFSVISFIVRITSKTANYVSDVPIIGTANKMFGAIFGGIKGLIILFVGVAFLSIIINVSAGSLPINDGSVGGSYIFKYIYNISPFNLIDKAI